MPPDVLRLTVERLAHGGDGVARDDDGRVVFVRGAAPGDVVTATVLDERSKHSRAEVVEVLEASPYRVEPRCPYVGVCGGCQWQHVSQPAQLTAKRDAVADALDRIARLPGGPVEATVPSPEAYGYRNRIEMAAESSPRLLTGFHPAGDDGLVEIDTCDLLPSALRKAPGALRGALRYVTGSRDLGLRRVGLRVSWGRRDVEVDLWTSPGPFPRAVAAKAVGDAVRADTVARVLVREDKGPRAVRGVEVLSGRGFWTERIGAERFAVSAPSFLQVNTKAAGALVGLVVSALDASPGDSVLDAYSGVGTFTLPLARADLDVTAVEAGGSAVRDLRRNLEEAGLHAEVAPGDVARALPELGPFDRAVVDPPRSGLEREALDALAAVRATRLVYVSCDPATFARDAGRLAEHGYRLTGVTPVDLFPQTFHVEVVGAFDLEGT